MASKRNWYCPCSRRGLEAEYRKKQPLHGAMAEVKLGWISFCISFLTPSHHLPPNAYLRCVVRCALPRQPHRSQHGASRASLCQMQLSTLQHWTLSTLKQKTPRVCTYAVALMTHSVSCATKLKTPGTLSRSKSLLKISIAKCTFIHEQRNQSSQPMPRTRESIPDTANTTKTTASLAANPPSSAENAWSAMTEDE
jgi:hypothetical protein